MKVRELKNFLELQTDEASAGQGLKGFAHWVSAIFQAKEYVTGNPKDAETLKKLEKLDIIELQEDKGQTIAVLTKAGKELYQDFFGHGYYL